MSFSVYSLYTAYFVLPFFCLFVVHRVFRPTVCFSVYSLYTVYFVFYRELFCLFVVHRVFHLTVSFLSIHFSLKKCFPYLLIALHIENNEIVRYKNRHYHYPLDIVQELCESRGGRPGLSVLTSLLVSVDVKIYCTVLRHWSQLVPNMSTDI